MKFCSSCKNTLSIDNFLKDKRTKDGLYCFCNPCKYAAVREWNKNNKEQKSLINHQYQINNRDKILERIKEKEKIDPNYKLCRILRARIDSALRGKQKVGSFIKDLGCSIPELKEYIEKQFIPGMNWGNHGRKGWHIDHRKALANFNLIDRKQFLEACHYTNLQPLWWYDNLAKSDKE
jgi:hypothetical protein